MGEGGWAIQLGTHSIEVLRREWECAHHACRGRLHRQGKYASNNAVWVLALAHGPQLAILDDRVRHARGGELGGDIRKHQVGALLPLREVDGKYYSFHGCFHSGRGQPRKLDGADIESEVSVDACQCGLKAKSSTQKDFDHSILINL